MSDDLFGVRFSGEFITNESELVMALHALDFLEKVNDSMVSPGKVQTILEDKASLLDSEDLESSALTEGVIIGLILLLQEALNDYPGGGEYFFDHVSSVVANREMELRNHRRQYMADNFPALSDVYRQFLSQLEAAKREEDKDDPNP